MICSEKLVCFAFGFLFCLYFPSIEIVFLEFMFIARLSRMAVAMSLMETFTSLLIIFLIMVGYLGGNLMITAQVEVDVFLLI